MTVVNSVGWGGVERYKKSKGNVLAPMGYKLAAE